MTLTLPQEKVKKIESEIYLFILKSQKLISNPRTIGSDQPFRCSLLNNTDSATSYATNEVFTTTTNSSYKKQSLLPVCNVSKPGLYSGTAMVVQNRGESKQRR